MTREEALGMAARLWCLPRNSHKEMDSELAEDVADLLLLIEQQYEEHQITRTSQPLTPRS